LLQIDFYSVSGVKQIREKQPQEKWRRHFSLETLNKMIFLFTTLKFQFYQ